MDHIEFSTACLSACIRAALIDLEKCERDPRYNVDMGLWHVPPSRFSVPNACAVCFAGSVMAQTFGVNHLMSFYPGDFSVEHAERFRALDHVRFGHLSAALLEMGIDPPLSVNWTVYVPDYREDPEAFKLCMREIATLLEEHDL